MKNTQLKTVTILLANIALGAMVSGCIGNGALANLDNNESKNVLYLVHNTTNEISGFSIDAISGQLSPINIDIGKDGNIPGDIPGDIEIAFNKYLYIACANSYDIAMYSIISDQYLTKIRPLDPSTVPTGASPWSVAIGPGTQYAYSSDNLQNTISQYKINESNGVLTPLSPATVPSGPGSAGIKFNATSTSEYAYVASQSTNTIWQYNYNSSTGQLTYTNKNYPTGPGPRGIWFDSNNHGYTINYWGNTISMFNVSQEDGSLVPLSTPSIQTGTSPISIAIVKSRYIYVASNTENKIYMYQIESNGLLNPIEPATVATGAGPRSIATDDYNHLYVVNYLENTISMYKINETSGVLSPLNPSKINSGPGSYADLITNGPIIHK